MNYVLDDSFLPRYKRNFTVSISTIDKESHLQDFYEILICFGGNALQTIGDDAAAMECGDIYLICPDVVHSYFQKPVCQCSCILITKSLIEHDKNLREILTGMLPKGSSARYIKLFADDYNLQLLKTFLNLISMEWIVSRPAVIQRQRNYLIGALTLISSLPVNDTISNPILEAKLLIDRDFTSDIKIKDIAETCGYSVRHFTRIFTQRFGISPKAYIIDMRLHFAISLLLENQLTIQKIAEMCGYCDSTHFSKEFKQKYKMLPSVYRRYPIQK